MNHVKSIFYSLVFALLLFSQSCSPKVGKGLYMSNEGEKLLMAGTRLLLTGEEKMSILHWTDTDVKYGEGSYAVKGNKMEVVFDEVNAVVPNYRIDSTEPRYADALTFIIELKDPLPKAAVSAFDENMGFMKGGSIGSNNRCVLNVPKHIKTSYILIDNGVKVFEIPIETQVSSHIKVYNTNGVNTFYRKGETKTFSIKKNKSHLQLNDEKFEYVLFKK